MVASFEYIEQVIDTFQRAAEANLRTPSRRGNVVVLDAEIASDVLVTADLHGHRRNFNAIRRLADLDQQPRRHLIMQEVCHGGPTYATGGCMSHTMLEDVARLKVQYPERFHFLLSNHELAELTDYPILKARKMLNVMFRMGLQEAYGPAAEKVREAYLPFLRSCPLAVRLPGDVMVCHTVPEETDARSWDPTVLTKPLGPLDFKEQGPLFRMMWGRDFREANARAFAELTGAKVLIHGHEPCEKGYQAPNSLQIILDCAGEKATVLMIPTDRAYTHAELVSRITNLS